jgi:ABC-type lipoprotein release transport system permease subunit
MADAANAALGAESGAERAPGGEGPVRRAAGVQGIAAGLGDAYKADDWTHTQGSLFSAMKMEKTMIGLLLLMIVAVAAFNIIATLIMVVNDKGADIAILRTIGATPRRSWRSSWCRAR